MPDIPPFCNTEVLERARAVVSKLQFQRIEGVPSWSVTDCPNLGEMMRQMAEVNLLPGDVIQTGFVRSGNHWVWEVLHMILNQTVNTTDREWSAHVLDIMDDQVHNKLDAIPAPRVVGTHFHPSVLPKDMLTKPVKVIYTLRNPKDVLLSWYKVACSLRVDEHRFTGSWDEFFELQLSGDYYYGTWFNHLQMWDQFIKDHPEVKVKVVVYEEMLANPSDVIAEVCHFLGQSDALARQIADATSFDNMKAANADKNKVEEIRAMVRGAKLATVTGKSEGWRSTFSEDQNTRFNAAFETLLKGNSLAERVKKYIY